MQKIKITVLFLLIFILFTPMLLNAQTKGMGKEYEINVVRPKYFIKKSRSEFGVDTSVVLNQVFTYTYLLSGIFAYHFTDHFGAAFEAAYGVTVDKEDKKLLQDEYSINIDIFDTNWITTASFMWTPVYGKYQLASGRLIYFDTYVGAGLGMMGITTDPGKEDEEVAHSCYAGVIGAGQRFYISKQVSLRWQIRNYTISYNGADKICAPADSPEAGGGEESVFTWFNTIVTQVGLSYFI